MTEVIEHLWHDPLFALSEVNRVLKSETGILLLSTPNFTSLRNRVNFLFGHINRVIEHPFVSFLKAKRLGHLGHCRLYAPQELAALLVLLGFEPTVSFTRYETLGAEKAQSQPLPSEGCAVSPQGEVTTRPAGHSRRSILRKLWRSPRSYLAAAVATSLAAVERLIPRYRPQIFVVARKVTDSDFERNYPEKTRQLVMTNNLSL